MQLRKKLQSFINFLDRPGGRWIIEVGLPLIARLSVDGVQKLRYHKGWIHYFADGIIVEPSPRMRKLHLSEASNKFTWGFLYTPKIGDIVVDIGAGLGSESFYFANKVGSAGRVLSIEAHPLICDYLSRTMKLNSFTWVTVLNLAVADRTQTVTIEDDMLNHLGNSISPKAGSSGIPVAALPIDEICLLEGISSIDFLKMNIEGAECMALIGMNDMIQRTKYLCISCHDFKYRETGNKFFQTKESVEDFLINNGFTVVQRTGEAREIGDQVNAYNTRLFSSGIV